MKKYTICICLLTTILFSFEAAFAQKSKTADKSKNPVNSYSPELENIRNIAQQTLSFQDQKLTAISLAQIAGFIWKKDEEYARYLFTISLGRLAVEEKDSKKEAALKNATYRKVISLIANHDPIWTKALVKSLSDETAAQAKTNIDIAENLLESDPKKAADYANQSLQIEITESLIWFLRKLKRQNEPEANRLFLQTLARYPQQANVDAYSYGLLGTYLFTSPFINPQDFESISMTRVGNIIFPNITVNLPNSSPNLIRAYIKNSILVINRPTNDNKQKQMKYTLGYLMMPKAREFAPELVGEIGGAMSALNTFASSELNNEENFKYLDKKTQRSLAERIEDIEKTADSNTRDALFLDIVFQAWQQNDFETAKTIAAKIDNKDVRNELDLLILFGEANNLLKSKEADLTNVSQMTEKLPVSLEKSLLWLGIADAAEKQKQTILKDNALSAAQFSAVRLNDENTPFLLLFVSGKMAKSDAFQSDIILTEAIKSFGKFETLKNPSPVHKVTLEPLTLPFSLAVSSVNLDFQNSFQKAINGKEETGIQIIGNIKDERLKGLAYIALTKSILAKKSSVVKNDETAVKIGEDEVRKNAVNIVMPVYPKESLKKQVKGIAIAEIQYNGNGDVTEVIVSQSPDKATGEAVVFAMRQWKFKQNKPDEKPISVRGKITFYFVIDADGKGEVKNSK